MQLKTVEEVARLVHEKGVIPLITQDRADIRAVLREVISNQLAFELDENGDALLRKHDILTLIDTLLPGDVSKPTEEIPGFEGTLQALGKI